jgi:alkanesulfonate monooxygenase SsuD/methylene tetrahydromethanopterin reductase-like flavin-dependent oxidoreductase (luciferase family)
MQDRSMADKRVGWPPPGTEPAWLARIRQGYAFLQQGRPEIAERVSDMRQFVKRISKSPSELGTLNSWRA